MLNHIDSFCLTTGQAAKWKQTVIPLIASRLAEKGEMLSRLVMVFGIAFFVSFFLCMNVLLWRSFTGREILGKKSYFVYNIPSIFSTDVMIFLCLHISLNMTFKVNFYKNNST